jgi:lipoate-protein ligase B
LSGFDVVSIPGIASFSSVHERMRGLLQERAEDRISDTLIFVEHASVITRGRGLQWTEAREERAKPLLVVPPGTDYAEIERGGDLTWHGPGQLVVYPVVKLGGEGRIGAFLGRDVDAYVRFLEGVWIQALKNYGVEATSRPGGSGVWLRNRKLASVGVAIRKWTTYHGVAMNIVNSLDPFLSFSPCGFNAEVMARIQDLVEIPRSEFGSDWRIRWEAHFLAAMEQVLSFKV